MVAVGVGDKNLSEGLFVGHETDESFHAGGVELVENIVEQQQRFHVGCAAQKIVLREPQGYGVGFALPLRGGAAHGHAAQLQVNVVAVRTYGSMAHDFVVPAALVKKFLQGTGIFGQMAAQGQ